MAKGKNRRSKVKYPALDPQYNLKSRQWAIDFDYLDKLNAKELEFLNSFMEEENNANFKHKGEKINKETEKKRIYDSNNARNRDVLSRGPHTVFSDLSGSEGTSFEEDKAIYKYDQKKKLVRQIKRLVRIEKEKSEKLRKKQLRALKRDQT